MSEKHIGKVIQVIGPVLDIQFKDGELPDLLNAIEIDNHGQKLVVEVAQLTGDNVARCIAMSSTDGLVRGTEAVDTGESIKGISELEMGQRECSNFFFLESKRNTCQTESRYISLPYTVKIYKNDRYRKLPF